MAANDTLNLDFILKAHVSVVYLLVMLPLCMFVLYSGFRRWKSKSNDASRQMSYSDFFTFNLAVMELVGIVGYASTLCVVFSYIEYTQMTFMVGSFAWYGEMIFPVFTCMEHYIAVVHPVTYLALKTGKGLFIRNICTAIVWVFSFGIMIAALMLEKFLMPFFILDACQMLVYLLGMFYCSVSVLKVLVHPKPGGDDKKVRVDKSKHQAFFIILLIMTVLCTRFTWNVLFTVFCFLTNVCGGNQNIWFITTYWFNLLTSLMLPLLYLHRAGKLRQCGLKLGIRR